MRLENDIMICPLCTGHHHAMACPSNAETLIAIGVQPWPCYEEPRPIERERIRPYYALRPSLTLIENVMAASGHSAQVDNSRRHLRAVG
jgi:hypothetical protein